MSLENNILLLDKIKAPLRSKIVAYSFAGSFAFFTLIHSTAKATDIIASGLGSEDYGAAQIGASVDVSSDTELRIKYRATRDLTDKIHHTFIAKDIINNRLGISGSISPSTKDSASESTSSYRHDASSWQIGSFLVLSDLDVQEEGYFNGSPGVTISADYTKYSIDQSVKSSSGNILDFNGELHQTLLSGDISIPINGRWTKEKQGNGRILSRTIIGGGGSYFFYKEDAQQITDARIRGLGQEFDDTLVALAPEQVWWWGKLDFEINRWGFQDFNFYINHVDYVSNIGKSDALNVQLSYDLRNINTLLKNFGTTLGYTLQQDTIHNTATTTPYFYIGLGYHGS